MQNNNIDFVSVGGATLDVFVKTDLSKIMRLEDVFSKFEYLCFPYGSKLNIDEVFFATGGGAVNTSINFANLGFNSCPLIKINESDEASQKILKTLDEYSVKKNLVSFCPEVKTGFSVILNSFEGDRTVLAFRGANSRLTSSDINFDIIKNAKWIYVSSLSGDSNNVLDALSNFAEHHGVSMAFNPGSTQIKRGLSGLKYLLSQTEFLILNKEEAAQLTGINENFRNIINEKCTGCGTCVDICPVEIYQLEDNKKAVHAGNKEDCIKGCGLCVLHCPEKAISVAPWASNIDEQLLKLKELGPKIVVITDGGKGVQVFDGKYRYIMPSYEVPIKSTLGAGDAFASTFTAAMHTNNWDIEKSIKLASANAANCVMVFDAHSGLKNFDELDSFISANISDSSAKILKEDLTSIYH